MRNPKNEKLKFDYRQFLAHSKGWDNKTVSVTMQCLHRFEEFIGLKEFPQANIDTAVKYVNYILDKHSLSFCNSNLTVMRDFYTWLERLPKYRTKMDYNIISYFQLNVNQRKAARAPKLQEYYDLDEVRQIISSIPHDTIIQQRNAAIISLQALCGLRTAEIRSMKMGNLMYDKGCDRWFVYTDPKDMSVKYSKARKAYFMPFDKEWVGNVLSWREYLLSEGFTDEDPFFPVTQSKFIATNIKELRITRAHIENSKTIRNIFRGACKNANVRYLHPHTFRHMIVHWAADISYDTLNAVTQSLGHSDVHTTIQYYGRLPSSQVGRKLTELEANK